MGTGPDFNSVLSGIDGATAVTAIIAAAAVLALVGFANWGAKKVGGFFDSGSSHGAYGSGDRTIGGFMSSGGDSVGRGPFHPDHNATVGSVERHLRKRG